MSLQFFHEDGQGTVVDELGRPEPMDYVVDEEQYALETTKDAKKDVDVRMREASVKRAYTLYSDQDKVRFFKLLFEKCLSAAAAAKQLGIHVRTAQRWAKQYEEDPDSNLREA